MKRFLLAALLAAAVLVSFPSEGQETKSQQYVPATVTVSKEKVNISGKVYWTHKVLEKQTLYSISKAYGVPSEAIMEANPTLGQGLKAGSLIFIPCDAATKVDKTDNQSVSEVKEPQTDSESVSVTVPDGYRVHTVRWFDSLGGIARKYNVDPDAISKVNHLENGRIKVRQRLLIPPENYVPESAEAEVSDETAEREKEEAAAAEDSLTNTDIDNLPEEQMMERLRHVSLFKKFTAARPAKISVILPLQSDGAPNRNYMDYYCGTLLALEDLKEKGVNAEVTILDSESTSVKELVSSGRLSSQDLIIGPVLKKDVLEIADYCDRENIPFVSPMDPAAAMYVEDCPEMFQVPASEYSKISNTITSMRYVPGDKVLLVHEKGGADTSLVRLYKEELAKRNIRYSTYSYDILQGRAARGNLESFFSKGRREKILVASNDEAFVLDCLRNLTLCIDFGGYSLEVWGQAKWHGFETLDPTYCHKTNLHVSMPYSVNYSDSKVRSFVSRYRDLYSAEPTPFSFQGYDITYYFLSALDAMGSDLDKYVEFYPMDLLQSKMKFRRSGRHGGFINIATKEVEYKSDYRIE